MGKRTVQDATISDFQKRKFPSKHYVYVIHISWSDGSVNVIYRRYSKFFDFQVKLLSLFPEESGAKNPTQRMIPFLPGKKLFGRSHTREVANGRMKQLNEYCKSLVRLPPKISECDEVIQFMTPTAEDINPPKEDGGQKKFGNEIDMISDPIQPEQYVVIADYKKQQKNEVDLHAGDSVEVFEKNDNGWWFINSNDNQGWAPGTFLSKGDGTGDEEESMEGSELGKVLSTNPCNDEHYITNNSYKGQQADEVSFETGAVLNVVQKSLDGWWKVSYQGKTGWVPAAFLQPYNGPSDITANAPTQRIGNVMNVSDILNKRKAGETGSKSVGTEGKPTPPRRCTVRGTVRKGATRSKRPPPKKKEYYTVADFASSAGDSISFQSGEKVQVVQESDSGWWLVKIGEEEGWAPSTYIEAKLEPEAETRPIRSSIQSLDEETGESKPPRPPPFRKTSDAAQGQSSAKGQSSSNMHRPVPTPPSDGNRSAFRPISNHGRPLPIVPAKKPLPNKRITSAPLNGGGSPEFLRAQSNLKPVNGNARKVPVKVTQLKNQLQSMKTQDSQSKPGKAGGYITTGAYANDDEDGFSFEEGAKVEVIQEDDSGWWLVRIDDVEGWAPSTYLEKL
ncbi:SH3 and PX domain-containing protein 2A-like isoform X2 [Asterias amurensis]|uniref:SH3 and PX domain-containing protein 2A-like isoform X2 n=1 Tax=Asterias amurensis TaxID=7602 RepID=UPI003AB1B3F6